MNKNEDNFRAMLLEAVDNGLSFLGEGGKNAMYYQAEKRFNLSRREIPDKLDEFHHALDELFGYGANLIEMQIVKQLYRSLKLPFEERNGWEFANYIEAAKKEATIDPPFLKK